MFDLIKIASALLHESLWKEAGRERGEHAGKLEAERENADQCFEICAN